MATTYYLWYIYFLNKKGVKYFCFLLANILQRYEGRRTRASPVLVNNRRQVERSFSIRFDYNPTKITRLALQLFMVSLEFATYYNLAACLIFPTQPRPALL